MSSFQKKKLTQTTLGERLRRAREERELKLEKISREMQIKLEYLEALEDDNYNVLPGPVFAKSYLKAYVEYLELDWERLKKNFSEEAKLVFNPKPSKERTGHYHKKALILPRFLYLALATLVITLLLTYLGWEINNFMTPPPLTLESPADNLTIQQRSIEIKGETVPEAHVLINGQEIAVDAKGNFTEVISLQIGFNNIQITAKTKHSREQVIYKQIIVEEKNNN